jgi:hypothetical protein
MKNVLLAELTGLAIGSDHIQASRSLDKLGDRRHSVYKGMRRYLFVPVTLNSALSRWRTIQSIGNSLQVNERCV